MLHGFYQLLSESTEPDGSQLFTLAFNAQHDIFKGHFPAQKVVPGVCQMEIIRQLAMKMLSVPLRISSAANIKFTAMIDPDRSTQVQVRLKAVVADKSVAVDSSIFDAQATFLKFKGTLTIDSPPASPL